MTRPNQALGGVLAVLLAAVASEALAQVPALLTPPDGHEALSPASPPAASPLAPPQAAISPPWHDPAVAPAAFVATDEAPAGEAAPLGLAPPVEALAASPERQPLRTVPHPAGELATMLDRLERAEQTIDALQTQLTQAQAALPESHGWLDRWGEYWRTVGDPELELVNFSTASSYYYASDLQQADKPKPKKWFEKYTLRGYAQFRINESIWEAAGSAPPQHNGDRSVSDNQNFLIRRARMIFAADISEHMYVYLQPDFASSVPGSADANHFCQIRDWYADLYWDTTKVHRFRIGQSKVPYGWENMQSSSNRIPLDRNDALNSAVRNERDLGIFYYWTPEPAQDFFKDVLDEGLKGSGNYGVFAFGFYNGQGGSLAEQNENLHMVTRLTIPYTFDNCQRMEVGVQAYTGMYTVLSSAISPLGVGGAVRPAGTLETGNVQGIRDERVAGTFVWYPQPFGFQAEWTAGHGPGLNDAQTEVIQRPLNGGYLMAMYRMAWDDDSSLIPFVRWNYYRGGYKPERNAPYVSINEWEMGFEWQLNPQMELTLIYTDTDRTNTNALSVANTESYGQYEGRIMRMQFQVNY